MSTNGTAPNAPMASSPPFSSDDPPVAIITGAASGIGLALSTHLYWLGYKVFMADISPKGPSAAASILTSPPPISTNNPTSTSNPDSTSSTSPSPPSPPPTLHPPIFYHTDVASWSSQLSLFTTAYSASGHIDFLACNAGIGDTESVYATAFDPLSEPKEPNLLALDVDLKAVFYGLKLFLHFARRETAERSSSGTGSGEDKSSQTSPPHSRPEKKLIITSSMMGLYPFPAYPTYATAKSGLLNLVRSAGKRLLEEDNIAFNAVLPAFVETGIAPREVLEAVKTAGHVTSMSDLIRAYEELRSKEGLWGETVEVSKGELYWRKQPGFSDWSLRWLAEDVEGVWFRGGAWREGKIRGESVGHG